MYVYDLLQVFDGQSVSHNGHGLAGNIKVVRRWLPVGWLVISREQSTVQIAVGRVGIQKRQRPATCNLTTAMCIETSTHRRKMCPAETAADDGPHGDHG